MKLVDENRITKQWIHEEISFIKEIPLTSKGKNAKMVLKKEHGLLE